MEIFVRVTARISEEYRETVASVRSEEEFFSGIVHEAGLEGSYRETDTANRFLQGNLQSVIKAHALLRSAIQTAIHAEVKSSSESLDQNLSTQSACCSRRDNEDKSQLGTTTETPHTAITPCDNAAKSRQTPDENTLEGRQCKTENSALSSLVKKRRCQRATCPPKDVKEQDSPATMSKARVLGKVPNRNIRRQKNRKQQATAKVSEMRVKTEASRSFRSGPKTCTICSKPFSKMSNMYRHMKIAHQGYRFPCASCEKKFTCKDSLDRHVKIVHEGLRCGDCTLLFSDRQELKTHQEKKCPGNKSNLQLFTCEDCGRSYSRQSNLNKHVRVAHKGLMFACQYCCRNYRSKEGLLEHQRHVHNMYNCHRCDTACECEMDFKLHMEYVHQETYTTRPASKRRLKVVSSALRKRKKQPATCEQCGKVYSSRSKLNCHIRVVHDGIQQQCQQCPKSFASKEQLKIHFKVFHEGEKFSCSLCSQIFHNRVSLAKHQQSVHKQLVMDNVYQCEICGKSFLYECNLCRHKKLEHEGVRFPCTQCAKQFRSKQKMLEHHKVEHEGHRFHCSHCSKVFKNKSKLKEHEISMHTNLRPHACNLCDETFARRSSLNYHVRRRHAPVGKTARSTRRANKIETATKEVTREEAEPLQVVEGCYSHGSVHTYKAAELGSTGTGTHTPSAQETALILHTPSSAATSVDVSKVVATTWESEETPLEAPYTLKQQQQQQQQLDSKLKLQQCVYNEGQDLDGRHMFCPSGLAPGTPSQQPIACFNNQLETTHRRPLSRQTNLTVLGPPQTPLTDKVTLEDVLKRNLWPPAAVVGEGPAQLGEHNPGLYNQTLQNIIAQCIQPALGVPSSQRQEDQPTVPFIPPHTASTSPHRQHHQHPR